MAKKVGKVKNFNLNLCLHLLLQIDPHILTCHDGKMLELQFFGAGNIAYEQEHINVLGELYHFLAALLQLYVVFVIFLVKLTPRFPRDKHFK